MKKALGAVAAVVVGAAVVAWSNHVAAQDDIDELNAVTDASIHTHLVAFERVRHVEAGHGSGVRVASR